MKANERERGAAILSVNLWEMALGTFQGLHLSLKKRVKQTCCCDNDTLPAGGAEGGREHN